MRPGVPPRGSPRRSLPDLQTAEGLGSSFDVLKTALAALGPAEPGARPGPLPEAAVAAIFAPLPNRAPGLLLIERTRRADDPWSGQIGLPGGRRDGSDPDRLATALRETREEVGLGLSRETCLASFPPLQARRRGQALDLMVHPFAFVIPAAWPATGSPEVESSRWVPLSSLLDSRNTRIHSVETVLGPKPYPAVQLGPHFLWGLTWRILGDMLTRLGVPWPPSGTP